LQDRTKEVLMRRIVASEFAHHFHVFRPDRRGHGSLDGRIVIDSLAGRDEES
jgi:hypothetical protein